MDFNTTIDIILKDLREVREIIDDLKNYPGLPRLQVELAKSKCKSAEEVIALLKTIEPSESEPVITPYHSVVKEPLAEKPTEVPKSEILIEITEEEVAEENKYKLTEDIKEPGKKTIEKVHETPLRGSSTIIADKFASQTGTISDKFVSGKKVEDLGTVFKRSKATGDLSDMIGISDKFLFIREIFNGNQSDYEQAIGKLNHAENLPDAIAVIMSYTGENEESEVVQQLLDIVKRKLPSDG